MRQLQRWSARTIGNVSLQLKVAREIIARLDAAQDMCPLTPGETWLRRKLKASYLGLASFEQSVARQRVCLAWLRSDAAAVSTFKVHASHSKQCNFMASLRVGDQLITDHNAMSEAAFHHFSEILGSAKVRDFMLDLGLLRDESFDLTELEAPFSEDEIWSAVKSLPAGKAPGPDGFTSEFLRACWDIIKHDICNAFDKFYSMNGRGFQKLNEALLTLLPKKPDAESLSDFRPINLIHIIAKLFAKVLSLRLAPRLRTMVHESERFHRRMLHPRQLSLGPTDGAPSPQP